jgi:hypothetical protein
MPQSQPIAAATKASTRHAIDHFNGLMRTAPRSLYLPPKISAEDTLMALADKAKDLVRALQQARDECAKLRAEKANDPHCARIQSERDALAAKNAQLEARVAAFETEQKQLKAILDEAALLAPPLGLALS